MIDAKELAAALAGGGRLAETFDEFLASSYARAVDQRYGRARYSEALARFLDAFPDVRKLAVARAPGRINLIGEHTDYNGLPVLPMAIERDMIVLFSPRKDRRVNLINASSRFPPRSFEISRTIRPYGQGNWGNYAKAAAQALQEVAPHMLRGIDACVTGDIPSGSGLSSSSALVVALAVALAAANGLRIERKELAELLARGERYVGTEGGGMDQAVCLLAARGNALKIGFFPLSAEPVPLPPDYSVAVCNSLVVADKTGAAREAYNRRVVECRLGVMMLRKMLGLRNLTLLSGLRRLSAAEETEAVAGFPEGPLTLRDAAKLLGVPASRLAESVLKLQTGELAPEPPDGFSVKQRVRHVLSEGRRVEQAAQALGVGDVRRFGELMNQSHESCARDYEVSTPELDALVRICREAGALGARLTGAGFGGCVIALVHDSDLAGLVSSVISRYYEGYLPQMRKDALVSVMSLEDAVFPCKPCGAAATLP